MNTRHGSRQLAIIACLLAASWPVSASPAAQPIAKSGSCPSGYYASGNYCVPSGNQSRFAMPKHGSCPSGYHSSGDYCLASSERSKMAVPKVGSCPSGYYSSGDYCVSSR